MGRFPLQLQTCASIWSSTWGKKTLNWTQLISIVAPVWSKRLSWKVIRCCTLKKDFRCHIFEKYFCTASLIHHNFSNALSCSFHWGKGCKTVQPMQLLILWGRQFEDAFDEKHIDVYQYICGTGLFAPVFLHPHCSHEKLNTSKKWQQREEEECRSDGLVEVIVLISRQHGYDSQQASASSLSLPIMSAFLWNPQDVTRSSLM